VLGASRPAARQKVRESFSRLPGHLIRRVHQVATAYFSEECGGELTAVQYAALVAIASHPGIDATRLAEIIYFDRSTIGDVLDRMEGKDWIRRECTPNDRRIKRLDLSSAGRAVLQQVEPGIRRIQDRLVAPLTAAEAKTLVRLLAKMADGDDDEGGDALHIPRRQADGCLLDPGFDGTRHAIASRCVRHSCVFMERTA
jgi:DNA-binding MarR family transcriptional regulator